MKKNEFKSLVKEIIQEVISEMETDEPDNKPVDMSDVPPATGKTDKAWRGKNRLSAKLDLKNPTPSNKTPFFKGPSKLDADPLTQKQLK